ncbi:outer membrane protein assembly factor [candidate division KSB1 bacterium]
MIGLSTTYGLNFKYYFNSVLRFTLVVFIISLYLNDPGFAQDNTLKISDLEIRGNKVLSAEEISYILNINMQGEIRETLLISKFENLISMYNDQGYLSAKIEKVEYSNLPGGFKKIVVIIDEGPLYRIKEVNLINDEENLIDLSVLKDNTAASKSEIESIISGIIEKYENDGYPYVIIYNDDIRIASSNTLDLKNVTIDLRIEKRKQTYVDSVSVSGNIYTNENVLIRESRLRTGEKFRSSSLEEAAKLIRNLPFIESVEDIDLYESKNSKSVVEIKIIERPANNFRGILGYVPDGNFEKGYYIGEFSYESENLLGSGRKFNTEWRKLDRNTKLINIGYLEPWILNQPVNLSLMFNQDFQDSSYNTRKFEVGIHYRLTNFITAHAIFGKEQVFPENEGVEYFNLRKSSNTIYEFGFSYTNMDNLNNPSKGINYYSSLTEQKRKLSAGTLDGQDSFADKIIKADLAFALPLRGQAVSFTNFSFRQTKNNQNNIPITQKWYLGGSRTVRGYKEKQFLADKIFWYNHELRYILSRYSRIFLFSDGGFYQNSGDITRKIFGYGFGMRIDSKAGIIGFDLGLSKSDTFSTAKLHFFLQNYF